MNEVYQKQESVVFGSSYGCSAFFITLNFDTDAL